MTLHVSAFDKNFQNAWGALIRDEDPNAVADLNGYRKATPLIIAAGEGAYEVFMALLIFGADVRKVDGCGHSALHHAGKRAGSDMSNVEYQYMIYLLKFFGAERCRIQAGCTPWCSSEGQSEGLEPPRVEGQRVNKFYDEFLKRGAFAPDEELRKVLFSFEGGGIRGAGTILSIWYIERILSTMVESQNGENVNIVDYVDYMIGTSTGAIIALGLASGKSVKQMLSLYINLKERVFSGFKPYSSEVLGNFLKEELGDITMEELGKRSGKKVIVCTSKGDERCPESIVFRTYTPPPDATTEEEVQLTNPSQHLIWEVGKWSASAPRYFTLDHPFLYDGGLTMNNPTLAGMDDMLFQRLHNMDYHNRSYNLVVSFGTGVDPVETMETSEMDIRFTSPLEIIKAPLKALTAIDVLVNLATKTNGRQVEVARNRCSEVGADFYRISPPLNNRIPLDETDNLGLCRMLFEFLVYMRENHRYVVQICERLIKLRYG